MVWGLVPGEALRGAHKYYMFAPGSYKIGRKDCDIVVQIDAAVSRLHAEIVIDKMISLDSSHSVRTNSSCHVRIKDISKFGTFVNKELGSKAVRLHHGEEATLNEGDTLTFGTGNASFRFCCVPFRVFMHSPKRGQLRSIQATAISIGATVMVNWSADCTHFFVNESSAVTIELIEAALAKQSIVLAQWFQVLAEKNICTELPSYSSYDPTLNFKGNMVRIADPKIRENCLKGFAFVLESFQKCAFGDKLQAVLKMIGAKFVGADEFLSDSQISAVNENNRMVLIISEDSTNEFSNSPVFSSLSRITDIKLWAAILSGNLDSSFLEHPSVIISSSHSTDETIVADSDVEMDTAISIHPATEIVFETEKESYGAEKQECEEYPENNDAVKLSGPNIFFEPQTSMPIVGDSTLINKSDKSDAINAERHENSDILYSKDLIVRNIITSVQQIPSMKSSVNFKCFRKRDTVSGNSFRDLIPFSKDPYKEADYGIDESNYIRDEKKRRKLEAIADDMFNSEKLKKRAAAGASLETFLARR